MVNENGGQENKERNGDSLCFEGRKPTGNKERKNHRSVWGVVLIYHAPELKTRWTTPSPSLKVEGGFNSQSLSDVLSVDVVKVMYVFGDATIAAGDFFLTNYSNQTNYPYGRDWPEDDLRFRARRFSNKYIAADYIATRIGIPIPSTFDYNMSTDVWGLGINFASGACEFGFSRSCTVFGMKDQMVNMILSARKLSWDGLSQALFLISTGAGDFVGFKGAVEPADMFAEMLGTQIKTFVESLYALGARKFLVNNIGPNGCTPSLWSPGSKACDEISNGHVKLYNQQLYEVLVNFTLKFEDTTVVLGDNNKFVSLFLAVLQQFGFKNVTYPCYSPLTWYKRLIVCCNAAERDHFLYFDDLHTTDATNRVFVDRCFSGEVCSIVGKGN